MRDRWSEARQHGRPIERGPDLASIPAATPMLEVAGNIESDKQGHAKHCLPRLVLLVLWEIERQTAGLLETRETTIQSNSMIDCPSAQGPTQLRIKLELSSLGISGGESSLLDVQFYSLPASTLEP